MADKKTKLTIKDAFTKITGKQGVSDMATYGSSNQYPTYEDRRDFYTPGSADYQGPMIGAGKGTKDRMPGTTPQEVRNALQSLLEALKIIPKVKKKGPVLSPGSRYVDYI